MIFGDNVIYSTSSAAETFALVPLARSDIELKDPPYERSSVCAGPCVSRALAASCREARSTERRRRNEIPPGGFHVDTFERSIRMGDRRAGPGDAGFSIVVPVHNEAGTVEHAVPAMLNAAERLGVPFEIIICENGSHDETPALVAQLVASDSRISSETLAVADYGRALQHAIGAARYNDIIIVNVDYWSADFFSTALAGLASHDMVIGSKVLGQDRRPLLRRVITRSFNLFLRVLFGFCGTDTHGMKAFRRAAAGPIAADCVSHGWIFDTELVLRAERRGLAIVEKPVDTTEVRAPSYAAIVGRVPFTLLNLAKMWSGLRRLPRRTVRPSAALVAPRPLRARPMKGRRGAR